MMMRDRKKLALFISGPKPESKHEDEYSEDMGSESYKSAMRYFLKAVHSNDVDTACEAFKDLCELHKNDEN